MKSTLIYIIATLITNFIIARPVLRENPIDSRNVKPDLIVFSFRIKPAQVAPGQKITLIYSIKNNGNGDIIKKDINYSFYLSKNNTFDPSDLRILSIDKKGFTLKSGKTISQKEFIWRMPSIKKLNSAGIKKEDHIFYLFFIIDRKNRINESREDNNIKYTAIYLL